MKNHKKVIILFMFLFIYFVIPSNVWAERGDSLFCTCTGENNASAVFTIYKEMGGNDNNKNVVVSKGVDFNLSSWDKGEVDRNPPGDAWNVSSSAWDRPSGDTGVSSFINSFSFENPQCPAYLVVDRYVDESLAANIRGGKYRGEYYIYNDEAQANAGFNAKVSESSDKKMDVVKLQCDKGQNTTNVIDSRGNFKTENLNTGEVVFTEDNPYDALSHGKDLESNEITPPVITPKKQTCDSIFGKADGSQGQTVAWILQKIFNYIRIFGILLTIVLSAYDFTKSIISNDFNSLKNSQMRLVYRIILIVALLLLPTLIGFLLGLFISGSFTDFSCGIF